MPGTLLPGVVVGHLMQQKPCRTENTALIKPAKVGAGFRTFLASF
jgi:hypothetical protein